MPCEKCAIPRMVAWEAHGRPDLHLEDGEVAFGNYHRQKHSELLDACLDAKIFDFLEWLNRSGVTTWFSCEDLPNTPGYFQVLIPVTSMDAWFSVLSGVRISWLGAFSMPDRVSLFVPKWIVEWFDEGRPALSDDEIEDRQKGLKVPL